MLDIWVWPAGSAVEPEWLLLEAFFIALEKAVADECSHVHNSGLWLIDS